MLLSGVLLLAFAVLFTFFPKVLVYPVIVMLAWMAVALLYKGYRLHHRRKHDARTSH
jgi:cardiolipin synthase A/B